MDILEIIDKKREKKELSKAEIDFFVNNYTNGNLPDYQISSLLMAICLNGMSKKETFYLTDAMMHTGEILDFSNVKGIKIDKHSTGGVSDTTTIVVAPVLTAGGFKLAKMSGGGLGYTGGTLDKYLAFNNFNPFLTFDKIIESINKIGLCLVGQTSEIAVADKKLYTLRDVTGTVGSLPLIASSIMSKKLACNSDIIILDIKYGSGAFMKNKKDAVKLAKLMIDIAKKAGKKVAGIITDMNQPLGCTIGNLFEVQEAIKILEGKDNSSRLYKVCKEICIIAFKLGFSLSESQASNLFDDLINTKRALNKLNEVLENQGGDLSLIHQKDKKPSKYIYATKNGYVSKIDTKYLGYFVKEIGGGKNKIDDKIDINVGLKLKCEINKKVDKGDVLCEVYFKEKPSTEQLKKLQNSFKITKFKGKRNKLIAKVVY